MFAIMIECAAAAFQHYINITGGVLPDHECVIPISDAYGSLVVRDDMIICSLYWGDDMRQGG